MRKLPKFRAESFLFAPVPYELPTVQIRGGTFYKQYATPGRQQKPLFQNLDLTIGHPALEKWAVVGPAGAGKTTFLELLRGQHVCDPASARQYPAISAAAEERGLPPDPLSLIQYLPTTGREGLLAGEAAQGAYMSARYESGREVSDLTLSDYLTGNLSLNPDPTELQRVKDFAGQPFYRALLKKLQLGELANQPLSTLSNGQTRRARIARALVPRPAMLMLDEPFLGVDPLTQMSLSQRLSSMSREAYLSVIYAFEDDQTLPQFITHVLYLSADHRILAAGPRKEVRALVQAQGYSLNIVARRKERHPEQLLQSSDRSREGTPSVEWSSQTDAPIIKADTEDTARERPPVVEMSGVQVRYGETTALGAWDQDVDGESRSGLWWRVRQGERWGVFGANGAGKTTLLSLINSDHPQAYGQPVKVFGRGRLPGAGQPGLPVFELQARMGQASPEIHNFFPRNLTVRQTLESAWAETFRARPQLTHEADLTIDATLQWFQPLLDPSSANDIAGAIAQHREAVRTKFPRDIAAYRERGLDWADSVRFGELDFETQRVALFLRAIVRKSELIVLDEAFGGMSMAARRRCMLWLAYGERQILGHAVFKRVTGLHRANDVRIEGLEPRQTLLCVAHRRDDVPPILNKWIILPPDGGRPDGTPPRFGEFDFHTRVWKKGYWWENMWWGEGRRTSI